MTELEKLAEMERRLESWKQVRQGWLAVHAPHVIAELKRDIAALRAHQQGEGR